LLLEMIYSRIESGDLIQYYQPTNISPVLRNLETQLPIALVGYHREWSPQSHTLFLAVRAEDTLESTNHVGIRTYPATDCSTCNLETPRTNSYWLDYQSQLVIYSAEAQQILLSEDGQFTGIFGGRYQGGPIDTDAAWRIPRGRFPNVQE